MLEAIELKLKPSMELKKKKQHPKTHILEK